MATIRNKIFVDKLADYMAGVTPALARSGNSIAVFSHQSDDQVAAETCSVLRTYDGRIPEVPAARLMLQLDTRSATIAAAMDQAEKMMARLLTESGRPGQMIAIDGFVVVKVLSVRPPRPVAHDEKNRAIVVSNFEVNFRPA